MSDPCAETANPFADCKPGKEPGDRVTRGKLPRVWDGTRWLSPWAAIEAKIIQPEEIGQPLPESKTGHLKSYDASSHLLKIPGGYVVNLAGSRYARSGEKPLFFEDLEKAKAEYWEAIHEAVTSGEVAPSDIGRKVHTRSVYSEDGCGENWETARVYECPGFAVIDYGSFPCTCDVPRFEIHDDVDAAKRAVESFVDELEMNAQGNIDYTWRASVWNEGEEKVFYGASWQEEEEEEEEEEEDDDDDDDGDESEEDETEEDDSEEDTKT